MADDWKSWWRERGDERLSLLLWAVWNPIGSVPLDEYSSYTGQVVAVLRDGHDADRELGSVGAELTDALQLRRNELHSATIKQLAALLESIRCERIGDSPEPDIDRAAAETLSDWYGWEMEGLARRF